MNEIMYTQEGIAWAYKPVTEKDPKEIAAANERFDELFARLEESIKKDQSFPRLACPQTQTNDLGGI